LKRRKLLYTLPPIILLAAVFATALASLLFSGRHTFNGKSLRKMSLESLANGTFAVERKSLDWLREGEFPVACGEGLDWTDKVVAGDGVYSSRMDDGSIELVDVGKNSSRTLVKGDSVLDVSTSPALDGKNTDTQMVGTRPEAELEHIPSQFRLAVHPLQRCSSQSTSTPLHVPHHH
jgi:hypothetical protein